MWRHRISVAGNLHGIRATIAIELGGGVENAFISGIVVVIIVGVVISVLGAVNHIEWLLFGHALGAVEANELSVGTNLEWRFAMRPRKSGGVWCQRRSWV
jgi:hypothetical protein